MKRLIYIFPLLLLFASCIEDKSQYEYRTTNKVTFQDMVSGYEWTAGEEVELVAPISFSIPFENEDDIDATFEITWFANGEPIASGYRTKYVVSQTGSFSIVLKVVHRETGETYISDVYRSTAKSSFGWGWIVLSEREEESSSLSFISPVALFAQHELEDMIDGGLGSGPKSLHRYYVLYSIPDVYISGLSKLIVNQKSGTVTLDGDNFMKDKWMRDEFASGTEPEEDFTMTGFAWKGKFYLIATEEGNVYLRCMSHENEGIPYYGTYSSTPYAFEGGARITCFNGFQNVTYNVPDDEIALMFDEQNSRFLAFISGGYGDTYDAYAPKVVYLDYYDQNGSFDAGVPPVNSLGNGTRCLAIGAYEHSGTTASGGFHIYPEYVSLLDLGGSGNVQLYRFTVDPISANNHVITENTMVPFSGASLLSPKSVIQMSTDFVKNPFFYFTDGDRKLYVYSMETGSHVLAYEASSRITGLCPSPLACPFSSYGANSTAPNFRLAVAQEGGTVSVLDVAESKMVRLFEGTAPDLELKTISGFGDIKDMIWATNYQGEF